MEQKAHWRKYQSGDTVDHVGVRLGASCDNGGVQVTYLGSDPWKPQNWKWLGGGSSQQMAHYWTNYSSEQLKFHPGRLTGLHLRVAPSLRVTATGTPESHQLRIIFCSNGFPDMRTLCLWEELLFRALGKSAQAQRSRPCELQWWTWAWDKAHSAVSGVEMRLSDCLPCPDRGSPAAWEMVRGTSLWDLLELLCCWFPRASFFFVSIIESLRGPG